MWGRQSFLFHFLIRKKSIIEHVNPLLYVIRFSYLFIKHAIQDLPHASLQNLLINSLHVHLDTLLEYFFLLVVYPKLSLLNPPKTLL